MNLKLINNEHREEALDKWRHYKKVSNANHSDEVARTLKEVYNQVKLGRKLIDIAQVIPKGGIRKVTYRGGENWGVPNLAIAPARYTSIQCDYRMNGDLRFHDINGWKETKADVKITGMPTYDWDDGVKWRSKELQTNVPKIPPGLWNKKLTDSHYILWEVDQWDLKVASKDPFLLYRVSKNIFSVLLEWELSDIEQIIMQEFL